MKAPDEDFAPPTFAAPAASNEETFDAPIRGGGEGLNASQQSLLYIVIDCLHNGCLCVVIYLFLESFEDLFNHHLELIELFPSFIFLILKGKGAKEGKEFNLTSTNLNKKWKKVEIRTHIEFKPLATPLHKLIYM